MKAIALNLRNIAGWLCNFRIGKTFKHACGFYDAVYKILKHHRHVVLPEDSCTFEDPFEIGLTNQN